MYDYFVEPIGKILNNKGINNKIKLLSPPSNELGDFCIVVNKFAGKNDPEELAKQLIDILVIEGIETVTIFNTKGKKKKKGIVYLNFSISDTTKKEIQLNYLVNGIKHIFSDKFGYLDTNIGKLTIVEHTSANPISPIHVGNLRNSVHGDTLARILHRTGYSVRKHFFVNDVGLQVSFVIIGYEIVYNAGIKPSIKFDVWLGQIYAIMNCLYTIQIIKKRSIKQNINVEDSYNISDNELSIINHFYNKKINPIEIELEELNALDKKEKNEKKRISELKKTIKKLKDEKLEVENYKSIFSDLKRRFSILFDLLYSEVSKIDLIERQITYLKSYEKKSDDRIVMLFKEVTLWVLDAFKWTLNRYNIYFDQFDFESEVSWSGLPTTIIDKLSKSDYASSTGELGVRLEYPKEAINKLIHEIGLSKKEIPIKGQVPHLQLRRGNGTALYAAKDVAYSIKKFEEFNPEFVYNVISTEQSLPQFQLLLPLLELGYPQYAKGLKHYAYENVELLGRPMSGRLATYVTADAFYDETFIRSRMAKRLSDEKRGITSPKTSEGWIEENKILHAVTLASTRYPLIDKSPSRRIILDIDKALDFRSNPGPFIQYAHARCSGILMQVKERKKLKPDVNSKWELVLDEFILLIIKHLYSFNEIITKSRNNLDPSIIASWCHQLAQMFMKFYELYPVLKAESDELVIARLTIIEAIRKGIESGLDILGIPATDRL